MGNIKSTIAKETDINDDEPSQIIEARDIQVSQARESTMFNSYSSRRASVNGPYYRARGSSIHKEQDQPSLDACRLSLTEMIPEETVPTLITWSQEGKEVYITGTFNDWKYKVRLAKSTHDFNILLNLSPGTHRFKFIVDNEWVCSDDMEISTDPDGNLVNYLQVMDEDWGMESDHSDEVYLSTIPPYVNHDPPTLPPHLSTPLKSTSQEDNSLLSEPNHVNLNHLLTCSMKDDILALSITSRYCKKYVTTMYYRPLS